jgi:polyhydroxybutyrate depolymerase
VHFLDVIFAEVERAVVVDEERVYATGISNGGAMAERLACERSTRFAAVASVGAGNQVAAVQGCNTARAVPVIEVHGTEDPCWSFEQGSAACLQQDGGTKVGTNETVAGWVNRNGCLDEPVSEALDDAVDDGTTTTRESHGGCVGNGDVVLLKVEGGGHTWPGGFQYAGEGTIGKVARDFSASSAIWRFFDAHPRVLED